MAVGSDQRVGQRHRADRILAQADALRQELQIDLVDDPHARRHDAEVAKRLLAPAKKLVALAVPLELDGNVLGERVGRAKLVDLHRVVDHQIDRHQRVDLLGIAAEPFHRAAHRRQVNDARHAGKVLKHNASQLQWDFSARPARGPPGRQPPHVVLGYLVAVAVAQDALQEHADRIGQCRDLGQPGLFQLREAIDSHSAGAGLERVTRMEGIVHKRLQY